MKLLAVVFGLLSPGGTFDELHPLDNARRDLKNVNTILRHSHAILTICDCHDTHCYALINTRTMFRSPRSNKLF